MNNLLIKLKDGRIGIGTRYLHRGRVHFIINGVGFYIDNLRLKDIEFYQPIDAVIRVYLAVTGLDGVKKNKY